MKTPSPLAVSCIRHANTPRMKAEHPGAVLSAGGGVWSSGAVPGASGQALRVWTADFPTLRSFDLFSSVPAPVGLADLVSLTPLTNSGFIHPLRCGSSLASFSPQQKGCLGPPLNTLAYLSDSAFSYSRSTLCTSSLAATSLWLSSWSLLTPWCLPLGYILIEARDLFSLTHCVSPVYQCFVNTWSVWMT